MQPAAVIFFSAARAVFLGASRCSSLLFYRVICTDAVYRCTDAVSPARTLLFYRVGLLCPSPKRTLLFYRVGLLCPSPARTGEGLSDHWQAADVNGREQ